MEFLNTILEMIGKFSDYLFGFLGYILETCYMLIESGQIALFVLLLILLFKLVKKLI